MFFGLLITIAPYFSAVFDISFPSVETNILLINFDLFAASIEYDRRGCPLIRAIFFFFASFEPARAGIIATKFFWVLYTSYDRKINFNQLLL